MRIHSIVVALTIAFVAAWGVGAAEDLKGELEALKKELTEVAPKSDAPDQAKVAFLELLKARFGGFAKQHPQTVEGFNAALTVAGILNDSEDPDAGLYSELATRCAPAEGVDPKAVAVCWAWVANAHLQAHDVEGVRTAVEKIKPLNPELYEEVSKQATPFLKRIEAQKEAELLLKPGKPPFAIEEKDLDDKPFSLANWKGKVVIIEFWQTSCPICMREMPKLVKLYEKFHDKGLEIVSVNLDYDEAKVRDTLKTHGVSWTTLFPAKTKSEIASKWGIMPLPAIWVVDRKGIIRKSDVLGDDLATTVSVLIDEKLE